MVQACCPFFADFIAVGVENAAGERRCRIYSEDVVGASSNYSNAIVIPALPHQCIVSGCLPFQCRTF